MIKNNKVEKELQKDLKNSVSKKNISSEENFDPDYNLYNKFSDSYDSDVVFGNKKVTQDSMKNFVMEYPDSALKFIFKKNLDGRPLIPEIESIYFIWEKRGLLKKDIKKYILPERIIKNIKYLSNFIIIPLISS